MFNLPGRSFRQRITSTSSVPMTLNDVIVHVRRHQQKIQRLETKRDRVNEADLTGTQMKRWVINLSKYKLSGNQNKILAKGLNYAVQIRQERSALK